MDAVPLNSVVRVINEEAPKKTGARAEITIDGFLQVVWKPLRPPHIERLYLYKIPEDGFVRKTMVMQIAIRLGINPPRFFQLEK